MQDLWRRSTNKKVGRYLIVGGSSFGIEFATFILLYKLSSHLIVANTLSFLVGLVYSFLLHKSWSFAGEHHHKTHHQFLGYASLATINVILSNIFTLLVAEKAGYPGGVAKIISMIAIVLWNFVILNKLIFRGRSDLV